MRNKSLSRRSVLKKSAIGAAALATPYSFVQHAWADKAIGNYPVKGSEVKFGFNVPQTGSYADEGNEELLAYKLAVKHLNNGGGMLETFKGSKLTGQGVLGKKVGYAVGDTQTNSDKARTSARRLIERDKVIMFGGGSSSGVAIAQQYLAQELGIIFMAGLTHSNDTTGKDKRRYGFRHFFNTHMTGIALGPVLAKEYGKDRRAYHLTADYTWGHSQYQSIKEATEQQGWSTVNNILTPLGSPDFSQFLVEVLNSDADVLVLNHYGKDMVNSLSQAIQFGMRDLQKDGRDFQIVVPLYSRLMAQGAGTSAIEGVYGTSLWDHSLDDAASAAFRDSFMADNNGVPPSQAGFTCYVQTLLYANACETAGTFYPPEVIKALEGLEFEGLGHSKGLYRASDHQVFQDIFVMQGKSQSARKEDHDHLEIVGRVKGESLIYDPSIFGGELGPYEPA